MGRPLTTLTMAQGARLNKKNKKFNLFFLSRFIGLFRKGVPHGRALVIGEDGKQVKVHTWRFSERLNILNTSCQRCYDRRCGRGPSTEAGQRSRILNLNFSIQRWGGKQLLSKQNKMKVDLRRKTLSFSERVETSKNEPPVFRLVSEICVGLPFCYLFIYKTNLNICLQYFSLPRWSLYSLSQKWSRPTQSSETNHCFKIFQCISTKLNQNMALISLLHRLFAQSFSHIWQIA